MIKKLIIATTAITRPELHNKSIPEINNLLLNLKSIEMIWIINIDRPPMMQTTQEETETNFKILINEKIMQIYIKPNTYGQTLACKNIIDYIKSHNLIDNETGIFWIEDDWVPTENINLGFYINLVFSYSWISFVNNMVSLNPSLIGNKIFNEIFVIEENDMRDVENILNFNMKKQIKKIYGKMTMILLSSQNNFTKYERNKFINMNIKSFIHQYIRKEIIIHDNENIVNILNVDDLSENKCNHKNNIIEYISNKNYNHYVNIIVPRVFSDIGRYWIKNSNMMKLSKNDKNFGRYVINENNLL